MAKNTAVPQQVDFLEDADARTRIRGYTRAAAERFGIDLLAHALRLDDRTLRNQLDYRARTDKPGTHWKPSLDCFAELFIAQPEYRADLLSVKGETISAHEDLAPEDFAREVYAAVKSNRFGFEARVFIDGLYRRMKKGGGR